MTRHRFADRAKPQCPPDRGGDAAAAMAINARRQEPSGEIQAVPVAQKPSCAVNGFKSLLRLTRCRTGEEPRGIQCPSHQRRGQRLSPTRFSFTGAAPAWVLSETWLVRRAAKRKTLYVLLKVIVCPDVPYRGLGSFGQNQKQDFEDCCFGQIVIGNVMLALPGRTVDDRNVMGLGTARHAQAEPAGQPHQMSIV